MARLIYIDNSNVFIEGQRVAAVLNNNALNMQDAQNRKIFNFDYRLDFGKLHQFLTTNGDSEIARLVLFGSRPPPNDSLWAVAENKGFEPIIEDRNAGNHEKKIDAGMAVAMIKDAYPRADKSTDTFILVAGDGDYVPVVSDLVQEGFTVKVIFWDHASRELQDICSTFISMNPYFNELAL